MEELLKKIPVVAVVLVVLAFFALYSLLINRNKTITALNLPAEAPIEMAENAESSLPPGMASPVSTIPSDKEIAAMIADQAQKRKNRENLVAIRNEKMNKVTAMVKINETLTTPKKNPDESTDSEELSPKTQAERNKEFLSLKAGVQAGRYFQH